MQVSTIFSEIKKIIPEEKIRLYEPMKLHTSFRIGGPADILILPTEISEIQNIVIFCKENKIPLYIIGNGSNLLVRDKGIRGVVVKIAQNFNDVKVEDTFIKAKTGILVTLLSKIALENSLKGLEFASGIPGTLGGAIVMNAGAYDGEFSNVIERVTVMDYEGNIKDLKKDELKFGYRWSIFQEEKYIILEALIKLEKGNYDEIKSKMEEYSARRKAKQPLNLPSAGSTFKRPKGNFAGTLIEKAGLKGMRIGDAAVSELHAGFIVNLGNATADDVEKLIKYIQNRVYEKFQIFLEPEVIILGEK
ncbi:MAG: UDP-N-acetylmuramate dehydrogenase [Thermovenabulum sp.]|uniref:UDP-N-acetylmuramate dehydrogenase n=1 Tax=Thermovenabulum sp. TaxID=3100335 RepID=UPI003C7A5B7A